VFGDAGPASGQDPDALDFGTTLILDGIASLIDRAASRA
jgi:hypothetical protein